MNNVVFIYVFSDENGIPKYIGKTKNLDKRIKQHTNRDRFRYKSNFYKWLNHQIKHDKEYYVDIIETCPVEIWQERESYWIKKTREDGFLLENMTDGGDGNNNQKFSEETKRKMSESQRGKRHTKETREKISKTHRGKVLTTKTREKLRIVNLGKKCPESVKSILSKAVLKTDKEGNILQEFTSLKEAANMLKCRKSTLSNVILRKKNRKFGGWYWKYK